MKSLQKRLHVITSGCFENQFYRTDSLFHPTASGAGRKLRGGWTGNNAAMRWGLTGEMLCTLRAPSGNVGCGRSTELCVYCELRYVSVCRAEFTARHGTCLSFFSFLLFFVVVVSFVFKHMRLLKYLVKHSWLPTFWTKIKTQEVEKNACFIIRQCKTYVNY